MADEQILATPIYENIPAAIPNSITLIPSKQLSVLGFIGKIFRIFFNIVIAAFLIFALCALSVSFASQKGLSFLGYRSFIILSGSMSPTFEAGAYTLTKEMPTQDIMAGDIISFYVDSNGTIVTHRVKQVINGTSGLSFITQGDANNVEDFQPIPQDQVLGAAFYWVDGLGSILLSLHNPRNFIFCVLILALLFFIPDLLRYAFTRDSLKETDGKGKDVIEEGAENERDLN